MPNSAVQAQSLLVAALHASVVSDQLYLTGIRDRSYGGSGSAPTARGVQHDQSVTKPLKQQALQAYNALRAELGLQPIPASYQF